MISAQGDSATTHDFNFYNAAGQVWNGSAYVTWANADYVSYRVAAVQDGLSGVFRATAPASSVRFLMRVRGASLALSYVVWSEEVATLADIEDQTTKDAIRVAMSGRWTDETNSRFDLVVTETPAP